MINKQLKKIFFLLFFSYGLVTTISQESEGFTHPFSFNSLLNLTIKANIYVSKKCFLPHLDYLIYYYVLKTVAILKISDKNKLL